MEGTILGGRYRIIEKIGEGGMAQVYRAQCTLLDRTVAVKVLRPQYASDEEFVARFLREAQAAARLSHPNVVNVYDVGKEGDTHYIVMEYVPGQTLKQVILEHAPLAVGQAVNIAEQILLALQHAHGRGIIHRDVKPHNILITSEGRVKVTDFGIARAASASGLTETGIVLGSVHYFSPEQAKGQTVGIQSDLYSLGIILYEMLTGRLPFEGDSPIAIALKQIQQEPCSPHKYNSSLPGWLEGVILKAMHKDPQERYPAAEEMLLDLRRWQAVGADATTVLGAASAYRPQKKKQTKPKKKWVWWLVGTFAVLTTLVALAFFIPDLLPQVPEVLVPDLAGRSLQEAERILEESSLRVAIRGEVFSSDVPANHVVSQEPAANRKTKVNRTIWLTLSRGPEYLTVPELVGQSLENAQRFLQQSGLKIGDVQEQYSSTAAVGVVLSQNPPSRTRLARGASVDLIVSRGEEPQPQTVTVPAFVGKQQREVTAELSKLGLSIGSVRERPGQVPPGQVIEQSPLPGATVPVGSSVNLVVSSGTGDAEAEEELGYVPGQQ